MRELSLVRSPADRHTYELEGVGWLQGAGWFGGGRATIGADGAQWECSKVGLLGGRLQAVDKVGTVEGSFRPGFLGRGGELDWLGESYSLRSAGLFVTKYRLERGGRLLWEFAPRFGGARPMVATEHAAGAANGAVLFAIFTAQELERRRKRQSNSGGGGGGDG